MMVEDEIILDGRQERTSMSYRANTMAADDLVAQAARTSAALVLI